MFEPPLVAVAASTTTTDQSIQLRPIWLTLPYLRRHGDIKYTNLLRNRLLQSIVETQPASQNRKVYWDLSTFWQHDTPTKQGHVHTSHQPVVWRRGCSLGSVLFRYRFRPFVQPFAPRASYQLPLVVLSILQRSDHRRAGSQRSNSVVANVVAVVVAVVVVVFVVVFVVHPQ